MEHAARKVGNALRVARLGFQERPQFVEVGDFKIVIHFLNQLRRRLQTLRGAQRVADSVQRNVIPAALVAQQRAPVAVTGALAVFILCGDAGTDAADHHGPRTRLMDALHGNENIAVDDEPIARKNTAAQGSRIALARQTRQRGQPDGDRFIRSVPRLFGKGFQNGFQILSRFGELNEIEVDAVAFRFGKDFAVFIGGNRGGARLSAVDSEINSHSRPLSSL